MALLSNLFGKKTEETSSNETLTAESITKIIQGYGHVLDHQAPVPGCVADVSKLPYPKESIKKALLITIKMNEDPKLIAMLKVGYIELSSWQEGVGEVDQGLDLMSMDLDGDPTEALDQFSEQNEFREKWAPLMERERVTLVKELKHLGLW